MTTAIDLIKRFEGCKLTAYKCPAGIWTIGYGHTDGVIPGKVICQDDAEELLKIDLALAANQVDAMLKVDLNDNQKNALYDFAFNLGAGALKGSTLLKLVNLGKDPSAEFIKWNHANGQVLAGLTLRRLAEKTLWLTSQST